MTYRRLNHAKAYGSEEEILRVIDSFDHWYEWEEIPSYEEPLIQMKSRNSVSDTLAEVNPARGWTSASLAAGPVSVIKNGEEK
mgnify:FL=1